MKKKKEISINNFALLLALIFFLVGAYPGFYCLNLKKKCTVEIKGIIVAERSGPKYPDRSHPKNKYLWGRGITDIYVETDGIFKYDKLSAGAGVGEIGDEVIIRYDPNDPDEYYFVGYYGLDRTNAAFAWGLSGIMIIWSLVDFIYYNIPLVFPKLLQKKQ